jgi:hypothetical protein
MCDSEETDEMLLLGGLLTLGFIEGVAWMRICALTLIMGLEGSIGVVGFRSIKGRSSGHVRRLAECASFLHGSFLAEKTIRVDIALSRETIT